MKTNIISLMVSLLVVGILLSTGVSAYWYGWGAYPAYGSYAYHYGSYRSNPDLIYHSFAYSSHNNMIDFSEYNSDRTYDHIYRTSNNYYPRDIRTSPSGYGWSSRGYGFEGHSFY